MRRALLIAAAATALLATSGCGGSAGDLLTISTHGGGGDNHRYVVTGDGRGSCDGGKLQTLPSDHVLDAREVERELTKPAKARTGFATGAPAGARTYVASTKDGIVTWTEGARGAPPVIGKAIALTQELKTDVCGR